ncbi:hypothetical protein GQ42DRAFT_155452 [Ramicandelaber brevisporus]|nr:hypothetical protein GQ42DRAFT_155452 [Ramicandelaber brevisporus]
MESRVQPPPLQKREEKTERSIVLIYAYKAPLVIALTVGLKISPKVTCIVIEQSAIVSLVLAALAVTSSPIPEPAPVPLPLLDGLLNGLLGGLLGGGGSGDGGGGH